MKRRRFLWCVGCTGIAAITGCATGGRLGKKGDKMAEQKGRLRPEDVAYCGVDCTACDVYRFTVQGETENFERALEGWTKTAQQHWGMETLDPTILRCRGCRDEGDDKFKGYKLCPIRNCVKKRDLASCALCPDWQDCVSLGNLMAECPEARSNLERVRNGSNKSHAGDG